MEIKPGQIWREVRSGRLIKILEKEVHGTGPAWTYCEDDGLPVPHGYEPANGYTYDDWFWHYSDALDFCVWKQFEFVSEG